MNKTIEQHIQEATEARGFTVTTIDKEAFLERLAYKDWSAYFLGKAFLSMYRTGVKGVFDFTNICNLDAEGKGFLFQTLFARDVEGWNDQYLYEIEQGVEELLNLTTDKKGLLKEAK